MNKILDIALKVQQYSSDQNGVFTLGDLKNLVAARSKNELYRILSALTDKGICSQFSRGVYVTTGFDLRTLSQRIAPESYISFGSVLADKLIIGSVPKYRVAAIKNGKSRFYSNDVYSVQHHGINKELFFGYENVAGVNIATAEKAFLDTLYFYKKGVNFSFDIYSDIDINALDKELLNEYLKSYKNKKFVAFAWKIINDEY